MFFAQAVARCEASPGGVVDSRWGRGIVVSRASEPYAEDKPYWYWIKFAELDLTIDEWLCFKMKELILADRLSKENRGEE